MPSPPATPRPTRADLAAARGRAIPDLIAPDLRILFVGINPSLYSAAVGLHFARPGNRFWPALHAAGFTPRRLNAAEQDEVIPLGFGITNLVARATARADEVPDEEFRAGAAVLLRKVRRYRPRWLAFVGLGAFRAAFRRPDAALGPQPAPLGRARVWLLPSPSGLNAHYRLDDLARLYADLRRAAG